MNGLRIFFLNMSLYAGPLVLLAAELFALVGLLMGFAALRKRREESKAEASASRLYEQLTEKGGHAQLILRREDRYPVFMTESAEEMTGISRERALVDVELLLSFAGKRQAARVMEEYEGWDGVRPFVRELRAETGKRWFQLQIVRSADGAYDLADLRDMTDEKTHIMELEKKLREAENASEYKTRFLSRMSHEIRTPMNGIMGMIALARTKLAADAAAMQYLDKAGELSQYLLSLINDILDMSRIEAGKLELEQKPFSLEELADKLKNMFQKNVEAKGVSYVTELLDIRTHWVIGDELRLSQVLVNFLSNSLKFTSEGEIRVTIREMLREEDGVNLMFRVRDTGIGMKPEFISRIFRPFEQESTDVTKKYGGSGLGMAIADQLVHQMGGEIVVDSEPGKGTDFTVYLRLPAAAEAECGLQETKERAGSGPDSEADAYTFKGKRILMAEDNEINAEIAVSLLEMEGASVETAANGKIAVEMFASKPEHYYDFILMDIQMPVMDGRTAAVQIRALNRADADQILIFALSADAFVEDQRESARCGMDGHFTKPIDFEAMRKGIGRIIKERGGV